MEEALHFSQATQELIQLVQSGASKETVDAFLTNWGLHSARSFISFMPASFSNDEILGSIPDCTGILTMYDDEEEEEEEEDNFYEYSDGYPDSEE